MKRLILMLMCCGMVLMNAHTQEKVLEEVAALDGVDVTYITKGMLHSMGNSNIKIGGLNISKVAKDLNSLQVLTADETAAGKVRSKLKAVGKDMEVIMKMKNDDERTDMYGVKTADGKYSKLYMCVDEGDEITVVYMVGNIGQNCFDELSRKAEKRTSRSYSITIPSNSTVFSIDLSGIESLNDLSGSLKGLDGLESLSRSGSWVGWDTAAEDDFEEELKLIEHELAELDKKISDLDNKKLRAIEKDIRKADEKIGKAKNHSERNKLYAERSDLYVKRGKLYVERGKLYEERARLYVKRSKLFENRFNGGSNSRVEKKKQVKKAKKTFSVADGNVDMKWMSRVEQIGVSAGYDLKKFAVKGTDKELASVRYRVKELHADIEKKHKLMEELSESKKTHTDEYIQLLTTVVDYNKRAYMLAEFYNLIYEKMKSE